jgi:hypothetical protein
MEVRGVCYHLGGDVEPKNLSVKFTLNLEEPSGYPAQPGLTWGNCRLPSPTRINLEEP